MDQPDLPDEEHRRALRALGRINWLSRSAGILAPQLFELANRLRPEPLRVLDLASGGGDVLFALAQRAAARGLNIVWHGCDFSRVAVQFASQQAANRKLPITFKQLDVLQDQLPEDYHVVMCSLFLHHLDQAAACQVLSKMRQAATQAVLVNDLVRSRFGYVLSHVACRLLTQSAVVHYDGPVSVAGAFTVKEVQAMAEQARLHGASITRHWPERFLLSWRAA